MPPRKHRRVDSTEHSGDDAMVGAVDDSKSKASPPSYSEQDHDGDEEGDAEEIQPTKRKAVPTAEPKKAEQTKKAKTAGKAAAATGATRSDTGSAATTKTADTTTGLLKRQQPKRSTDGKLLLTVGITGARAGNIIEGSAVDTVGVVLRVVRGTILVCQCQVIDTPHQRLALLALVCRPCFLFIFGCTLKRAMMAYDGVDVAPYPYFKGRCSSR